MRLEEQQSTNLQLHGYKAERNRAQRPHNYNTIATQPRDNELQLPQRRDTTEERYEKKEDKKTVKMEKGEMGGGGAQAANNSSDFVRKLYK